MLKNYNKDGQKLPLFGIGPYMIFGMGLTTLAGIILFGYVFKIGILEMPWIMVFRIMGALLIISGIFIWFTGAVRSDMDDHIESNKLKTNGIYAWVRNPMYSGWWIAFAGITLMWHNIWMLVLPVINWIIMTITLINSEEKWLLDLYGAEYETYKTKVNRCIPWKPCEDRIYVTDISNARWMAYDIPGNVGWIIYIACLVRCFIVKPDFISSWGLFGIIVISVIPAIFMMIGIAELVSERFAHLDRRLPKVRLLRGFGALVLGGTLGMTVSVLGLIYGYCIGERNLITIWCMLLGSFLCFIFAELIYKTYR
ncbi:methyltransferase family protein [Butyrivibrio fibrisolvens]|uniref:methyltransferase family protein n=1 Tax=Butyrivibrio fibrisolvens TaxID=831 RepID=UPI0020C044DF|nr:isoprenylcysteine carboxylmethyltransferase family protein [Butyrivibrio fibrisolvens]